MGTTFYRAPEQEGIFSPLKGSKGDSSYGLKADIYSLGIVIFEMYHPKFSTYMERSETLKKLISGKPEERFPEAFSVSAPKNAEDLIVWCLERDPAKRPSSQELLKVSAFLCICNVSFSKFINLTTCHNRAIFYRGKSK